MQDIIRNLSIDEMNRETISVFDLDFTKEKVVKGFQKIAPDKVYISEDWRSRLIFYGQMISEVES